MGKSVFLPSDVVMSFLQTADNLMIAKLLYDEGIPLDNDHIFVVGRGSYNDPDTIEEALKIIFETDAVEFNDDDRRLVTIKNASDIQEWFALKKVFGHEDKFQSTESHLEGILDYQETVFGFEVNGSIKEDGISLVFEEEYTSSITHYELIEELIEFRKVLKKELQKWRERYERVERRNRYKATG